MTASTLVRFAADREPGRALDLGCARGDDVVWLAGRGWYAIGTDASATALEHTRANAFATTSMLASPATADARASPPHTDICLTV